MGDLLGIGVLIRGISILYVVLSIIGLVMSIYIPTGRRNKAIAFVAVLAAVSVLPIQHAIKAHELELKRQERQAFAKEAWGKFKQLCDSEAGEKIYKTFRNVKSVYIAKPLPPATEKDLSDQYWRGDPYSDATPHPERSTLIALSFVEKSDRVASNVIGRGYDFVEMVVTPGRFGAGLRRMFMDGYEYKAVAIEKHESRFGVSWEDLSTDVHRKYWISKSRLTIWNLSDNSLVAERIGFLIERGFGSDAGQRRAWLSGRGPESTCPLAHSMSDRWFVFKVLNPPGYPNATN